jgi:hypothetical protein
MSDTISVTLAGKEYQIRKLTLNQSRKLRIGTKRLQGITEDNMDDFELYAIDVISTALTRAHPDMTAEAILELETTTAEILQVYGAVMEFAGFSKKKADGSGEALPVAT